MDSDALTSLPKDVILQILQKLPTRALLQIRCVAKLFISLISLPHFIKLHLSSSIATHPFRLVYFESADYSKTCFSFHVDKTISLCKILDTPFKSVNGYLRLAGCSGGVVCLFDTNYYTFVGTLILWNPFIGKFKLLPCLNGLNNLRINFSHVVVGFGFDHRVVDFKVVKILFDCDEHQPKAFVYGVNIGLWKRVDQVVPCFMPRTWSSSVFVNGVVHWLVYKQPNFHGHPNCILGFDLGEETFRLMDLPQNLDPNIKEFRLSPAVEETSVVLFVCNLRNVCETWDAWLMSDYGMDNTWVRMYTIVLDQILFPLKIVSSGKVLAAMRDGKLALIDVEKEEIKDLGVCGLSQTFYTSSYAPSLALLDVGEKLINVG